MCSIKLRMLSNLIFAIANSSHFASHNRKLSRPNPNSTLQSNEMLNSAQNILVRQVLRSKHPSPIPNPILTCLHITPSSTSRFSSVKQRRSMEYWGRRGKNISPFLPNTRDPPHAPLPKPLAKPMYRPTLRCAPAAQTLHHRGSLPFHIALLLDLSVQIRGVRCTLDCGLFLCERRGVDG